VCKQVVYPSAMFDAGIRWQHGLVNIRRKHRTMSHNKVAADSCDKIRACLDQLLIAIRSLLIVCDHVRSKERLIAIDRPIATPLGGRQDGVLSMKCRCRCLADYKHSMGRAGRWGVSESVAAAAARCVALTGRH